MLLLLGHARRGLRARQPLQDCPCPAPGTRGEHELQPSQLHPTAPGRCPAPGGTPQDPAAAVTVLPINRDDADSSPQNLPVLCVKTPIYSHQHPPAAQPRSHGSALPHSSGSVCFSLCNCTSRFLMMRWSSLLNLFYICLTLYNCVIQLLYTE